MIDASHIRIPGVIHDNDYWLCIDRVSYFLHTNGWNLDRVFGILQPVYYAQFTFVQLYQDILGNVTHVQLFKHNQSSPRLPYTPDLLADIVMAWQRDVARRKVG